MAIMPAAPAPRRLGIGDKVPELGWRDPRGRRISLELPAFAGRVTVVFICASAARGDAAREVAKLRDLHDKFRALDVQVLAVTADPVPDNAALSSRLGLPYPVLSDPAFAFGRAVGLDPAAKKKGRDSAVVIADPNQRIEKIIGGGVARPAIAALAHCEKRGGGGGSKAPGTGAEAIVTAQAPVLIVPNVIDRDHCARLVRFWETGERYEGGVASAEHGRNVPIENIKVREDVALADTGPEAQALFAAFRERLFPEVQKAFQYRVTRAETLRIGCYTAEAGGHFVPHRDDTTPYTAHRRFAMSLNLNAGEYEGGGLRFPEYGPQLYGVGTGGAVVFSCSLLHEATRVTRGRRLVLLGFFYSEAEQAIRERVWAKDRAATQPR